LIGERIRYFRKLKNITQKDLADGICAISYLSKIENGVATASEEVINMLCERLGLDSEEAVNEFDGGLLRAFTQFKGNVKNRNFSEAEKLIPELNGLIQESQSQEIRIQYDIYLFGLYVFTGQVKQSTIQYQKIHQTSIDLLSQWPQIFFDYYYYLSLYLCRKEEFHKALKCNEKLIGLMKLIEISEIEKGRIYFNQAWLYTHHRLYFQSIQVARNAIESFEAEFDIENLLDSLILIGVNQRRIQDYYESEKFLKRALQLSEKLQKTHTIAITQHNLGYLYSDMGRSLEAIDQLQSAFQSAQLSGNELLCLIYLLSKEYMKLEQFGAAMEWCDKGLSLLDTFPYREYHFHFHLQYMEIRNLENEQYEETLREAIDFFEKEQLNQYVVEYAEKLANYYFQNTKYKKASELYRLANKARQN